MSNRPQRGILMSIALGAGLAVASPALGLSLFGIHLWGDREEDDDRIEVIDPLPYTVTIDVTGGPDSLQRTLERASSLWTDRETPASGNAGLLAKARGDYRRLLAALYGEGFYGPYISIRANGQEVSDVTLAVQFPSRVPITIDVTAGPRFRFGATEIINPPPPPRTSRRNDVETAESVGFSPGETARLAVIDRASAVSIERWRHLSYAKARESGRDVVADHLTNELDVRLTLDPNRPARYGQTTVRGTERVDPKFVAFMADLPEGQAFDPEDIQAGQDRLTGLGIFNAVRFVEAEEIAPDGSLPMTVVVQDRRPRTIGIGGTLSTIDGVGIAAYWQHRNVFGRGERLRFDASVDGLGGSLDPEDYDYNVGVTFTKPGVWTPDTSFVTGLVGQRVDFDTYREESITANAGFSQTFGRRLTGDLIAQVSRARYEDDFGIRHFTTFGLIGRAQYDRRNNALNATRGYFLAVTAQPFYEADYGNTAVRGTIEGRVYKSFGEGDKIVLAGRALAGTFYGADIAESPPDLLFFAGGGGSVRGYAYNSIGVETFEMPGEDFVVGGRSLLEGSAELRYRINQSFGAVGFIDSGFVAINSNLSGDSQMRSGAGLGVRYFTGLGVLRADLATPLDPRPEDSAVALYIGIGQAF